MLRTAGAVPWLALAAVVLQACDQGFTLVDPASEGEPGSEPGAVQRATLSVAVTLSGEDSVLAERIGSPGGTLREALVTIVRERSTDPALTAPTDESGIARFDSLLEGRYRVSALRVLTSDEIALLDTQDSDVKAFGGGSRYSVSAPSTAVVLRAFAGRAGSLVISEVYIGEPRLPSGEFYSIATYIELYNNSDTIIYLDGKVLVKGMIFGVRDRNETFNCETMARWQFDPEGIWTGRFIEAFPGSGRQYPLAPGRAVVVATDAVDHRPILAGLPDLSRANFEFIGSADVDNPSVPNMVRLGREFVLLGHGGLLFGTLDFVFAVADSLDVASLLKEDVPGALSPEHWQVPRKKILDVVTIAMTPELEAALGAGPQCPTYVHESFDRQQAPLSQGPESLFAIARRVLGVTPDGRNILQRTKTSSLDLTRLNMTPGSVP